MIILEKEFVSGEGGYSASPGPLTYKQVAREGKFAIYQRFYVDGSPKDFEVVVIRTIPKGTVSTFPAPKGQTEKIIKISESDEEHYAVTSSWGRCGWSYHGKNALNGAKQKFAELCKDFKMEESGETEPVAAIIIPEGRWTTKEFGEKNGIDYAEAVKWIKENLDIKIVALGEERRNVKGPMSKVFGAKTA